MWRFFHSYHLELLVCLSPLASRKQQTAIPSMRAAVLVIHRVSYATALRLRSRMVWSDAPAFAVTRDMPRMMMNGSRGWR